jgi:hypothetical protein
MRQEHRFNQLEKAITRAKVVYYVDYGKRLVASRPFAELFHNRFEHCYFVCLQVESIGFLIDL